MATRPTASPQHVGQEPFLEALSELSLDERLAIYRSGGFTRRECGEPPGGGTAGQ
jgi:hypothetical protein